MQHRRTNNVRVIVRASEITNGNQRCTSHIFLRFIEDNPRYYVDTYFLNLSFNTNEKYTGKKKYFK
jgi:hypothetical protein